MARALSIVLLALASAGLSGCKTDLEYCKDGCDVNLLSCNSTCEKDNLCARTCAEANLVCMKTCDRNATPPSQPR